MTIPHVRLATDSDIPAIAAIYNHYILTSSATFEENELSESAVAERVGKILDASYPWTVIEGGEAEGAARERPAIEGYAYARRWHDRAAYRFSVETSLYVAPDCVGQGRGEALYRDLLGRLLEMKVRTAIGGIALPNDASVALHNKLGFEKAAHYKSVGYKFSRWIDVVYYQYLFPTQEQMG